MKSGNSDISIKNIPVVIVASAFGAEAIRIDGHAPWARAAAQAGASGFEVRRELFSSESQASLASLHHLGQQIHDAGIWAVYSTPATLFDTTGALDDSAMRQTLTEANALGARIVKFQLGGSQDRGTATDRATLDRLKTGVAASKAKVVVENGQLKAGGTIDAFAALFEALSETLAFAHDDVRHRQLALGRTSPARSGTAAWQIRGLRALQGGAGRRGATRRDRAGHRRRAFCRVARSLAA